MSSGANTVMVNWLKPENVTAMSHLGGVVPAFLISIMIIDFRNAHFVSLLACDATGTNLATYCRSRENKLRRFQLYPFAIRADLPVELSIAGGVCSLVFYMLTSLFINSTSRSRYRSLARRLLKVTVEGIEISSHFGVKEWLAQEIWLEVFFFCTLLLGLSKEMIQLLSNFIIR